MKDMRQTLHGEYEDAEMMELLDEMDSLRHSFERLLQQENPQPTGPGPAIPPEIVDAALEAIPEGWRGLAGIAVRQVLKDPARMKEIQAKLSEKVLPYLQKQGLAQVPAQQQTPTLPVEFQGRPYDPNGPRQ
jgi:hypothetical protein